MICKINSKIILVIFAAVLFLGACKKDDNDFSHNASAPVVVNSFEPALGGYGTEILINGSNFTTDTSKIKVSINGVPLKVVGVKGNQVMAFIATKTGTGPIVVSVDNSSATSTDKFMYTYSYKVATLAGSGNAGFADGKGDAASFNFNGVRGQLSVDNNLNVYVPDGGNQRIRKITPDGTVSTIAGTGENGFADGDAATAKFNNPCGTTFDANGNLYVAERNGRRIRKITPDGTVSTYAYSSGNGGNEPTSVVINKTTGNIYWSDFYGDGVYALKNGTVTRVISYSLPCTIAIDGSGNIYATHFDAQTVRKYTYNASTDAFDNGVDIAGMNGQNDWLDAVGTSAKFSRPWGLAIDANNNLYTSGQGGGDKSNCVRLIQAGTFKVTTIAGVGDNTGYLEGIGSNARFNAPTGIAVDKNGDLYVLDMNNNRVRKITVL